LVPRRLGTIEKARFRPSGVVDDEHHGVSIRVRRWESPDNDAHVSTLITNRRPAGVHRLDPT